MSKKNTITENYIYNLIYRIVIIATPVIFTPYISRVLGSEGIGIYSFTQSISQYFLIFGAIGTELYAKRKIAYIRDVHEITSKTFWEILVFRAIFLTLSCLIFLISVLIVQPEHMLIYFVYIVAFLALILDIAWIFEGMENFKIIVLRNVMIKVSLISLVFIFVKKPEDIYLYAFIIALSTLLGNLAVWPYIKDIIKPVKLSIKEILGHFIPTSKLFLLQLAGQVYMLQDRTILGIYTDMDEVGQYYMAQRLIQIALPLVTVLSIVMMPRISNYFANNEHDLIKKYITKSFQFCLLLAIPLCIGLFAASENFVSWFLGADFEKTGILLKYLSPLIIFMGLGNLIGMQILIPMRKERLVTIITVIDTLVCIGLNFVWIPFLHSIGAAISALISKFIATSACFYMIRNTISFMDTLVEVRKYILSGIVMFLVLLGLNNLKLENYIIFTIQFATGFVTYFGCLYILKSEMLSIFFERFTVKSVTDPCEQ